MIPAFRPFPGSPGGRAHFPEAAMKRNYTLNIRNRSEVGSGPCRRLRRADRIPACVYGPEGSRPISVAGPEFRQLSADVHGGANLIELHDEQGGKALSLIQEVQTDTIKRTVHHIDFLEVSRGHAFTTHVPVQISGEHEAEGVRNQDGMIDQVAHQVNVRCLPKDLPEHIEVDVSGLSVGDGIHVADLPALEGVEYLDGGENVVVSCVAAAQAPEEEASEEAAEGEEAPGAEEGASDEKAESSAEEAGESSS